MRLLSAVTFLTPFAVAFAVDAAPLPSPEQVDIPLGSGILHAQLYKPDGDGPFPTVIALHACGGLAGNSEPVQPRYRDWAEQLLKAGNAVLLPDSYGSRELGPQCRVNERRVLARRERVVDVMASRQWLVQQPWIARDRISLIGWANGASALLWAVRPQLSSRGVEPDFRSAIAFYPDCRISSGLGWSTRVPTLLVSKRFDKSGVAHDDFDTSSILKLIEWRFDVGPLVKRPVRNLAVALKAAESDRR